MSPDLYHLADYGKWNEVKMDLNLTINLKLIRMQCDNAKI
jgi:hypothetical protein